MEGEVRIFHGSEEVVVAPVFGKGNPHNDYGLGFYCTEHIELAKEWSCKGQELGVVNEYLLEGNGLSVLDLCGDQYHVLNWLSVLLENRTFDLSLPIPSGNRDYFLENFLPDYQNADIIRGYRADDSYFSYAKDFLSNTISLSQLQRAMKLGRLGEQIAIKSERAFDALMFVKAHAVEGGEYYPKRLLRDRQAREDYFEMRQEYASGGVVLASDIVRQNWKNDDTRLR